MSVTNEITHLINVDETDLTWRELSSCRDMNPDLFFSGGGASHKAKKVCFEECPVREMCLALALKNDERFGIWGGLTRAERARLRSGGDLSPVADVA